MLPGHTSFKAEIKKLKFETEVGVRLPGTALIHLQVPGKEKPVVELMGYLEEKEIYNAIDRGEGSNQRIYSQKRVVRGGIPSSIFPMRLLKERSSLLPNPG